MKKILTTFYLFLACLSYTQNDTTRLSELEKLVDGTSGNDSLRKAYLDQLKPICDSLLKSPNKLVVKKATHSYCFYLDNLGILYSRGDNNKKALECYYSALKYAEKLSDSLEMAGLYHNIGIVYQFQEDTTNAIKFYTKSLIICQNINEKYGEGYCLTKIGNLLLNSNKLQEAKPYIFKAMEIRKKIGEKSGMANSYISMGRYYTTLGVYDSAIQYIQQAIKIQSEIGDKDNVSNDYYIIGKIYLDNKKELLKAKEYGLKSLAIAKTSSHQQRMHASNLLYEVYKAIGDPAKALYYFEVFTLIHDSLKGADNKKELVRKELEYSYGKRAVADSVKFAQAQVISQIKIQKQETQRNALYAGLGLVLIFAGILYNRFRIISKQKNIISEQKHLVEEKQQELLASIRYAKRIQQTLLTSEKYIQQNMNRLMSIQ